MKSFVITGAVGALTSVMLGALGAHKLDTYLPPDAMQAFNTAVEYQMFHSLAVLLVCVLPVAQRQARQAAACFVVGTLLFSGSIYGLTLAHASFLGPVTPLGGLLLMIGWLILIFAAIRSPSNG